MKPTTAVCLVLLMGAAPVLAASQPLDPKTFSSVRSEDITFEPFAAFPAGAELAVVVGDPQKPGPYVVRVRVPEGVKLMPHVHPEDRVYTVISGVFYIGYGATFDPAKLVAYGPGSVVVLPANTPHFHWARSGTYVTQVTGTGPLGLRYLNPNDDPRTHGDGRRTASLGLHERERAECKLLRSGPAFVDRHQHGKGLQQSE